LEASEGTNGAGLLERDREVASLHALIEDAAAGQGRMALIEGPAGIGKSRLLGEARAAADGRMRVLTARGSELEREFPFGVVRQLFEPVLVDARARDALLAGAAGSAAPVFGAMVDAADGAGDASFATLHGLYWLCVNLAAEEPLLLAIDDLHWCDRPSLRFLAYLVRRLDGLPVLLASTLRTAEPGADVALLGELAGDPMTVSVRPGPLSLEAVTELVRARLLRDGDAAFCAACHDATGGNPLMLHELLKAMAAEGVSPDVSQVAVVKELGPRAASRAVILRLAHLSPDALAVARTSAVLGDGADLGAVATLSGVGEDRAAQATGELTRAEILQPQSPLRFVHPLVASAIYHDIAPGERQLLHTRAAELLVGTGAPAEQVAAHLLSAPARGDAATVRTLQDAARSALAKGAADSATAYLRRALEEPPPGELLAPVLVDLGLAEALTSGPSAAETLRAAYEELGDPIRRGWIALVLARILLFTGRTGEGATLAARARAELGEEQPDLGRRLEAVRLSVALFDPAATPLDEIRAERYRGDLDEEGVGARMLAGVAAYEHAMRNEPAADSVELARLALADGTLIEDDNGGAPVVGAIIVLTLADEEEALAACERSLAKAHLRGSLLAASAAHIFRGFALARRGDLTEAEEMLRTGAHEVHLWQIAPGPLYPASFLAEVLTERGDLDGAREALAQAGLPPRLPDTPQMAWFLASRLGLLVASGQFEEALDVADDCARRFEGVISNPAWIPWRSFKAEALDRLGRRDEALELAREELELARHWGAPRALGRSLRVLGSLQGGDGIEAVEEAVRVLEGSPARLEHAKALATLGTLLRLERRPTESRDPLRAALEIATVCGADALAERARSELAAAGARPRRDALSGVDALTPSERRVADLAAGGQSNRDIAQSLYVTPKTVEVHLSNAYRKLGIGSRLELPSVLAAA
jgi:DNA-binding CsgD family transcriptional regulator